MNQPFQPYLPQPPLYPIPAYGYPVAEGNNNYYQSADPALAHHPYPHPHPHPHFHPRSFGTPGQGPNDSMNWRAHHHHHNIYKHKDKSWKMKDKNDDPTFPKVLI
jgi:hypothetical protein